MSILLAITLLIGVSVILKKLVERFGGPDAQPMSYWDSFVWIAAPRLACRLIFYFYHGASPTAQIITWAIGFFVIIPLGLRLCFSVPLLRAFLITLAAMSLLMLELVIYLLK